MDELNILLKAKLDINNSIKNINNQIDEVSKKLKDLNISLNVDDVKNAFESMFKDINKQASNVKVYDSNETKNEISKTVKDFKSLQKEINNLLDNGFKKSKTSTSFIDIGDGNKLKKIVEEYNDELNNSVKITQNIDTKTGELVSVQKTLADNVKARVLEEEKLINAMAKGRELSEAKSVKNDRKEEIAQVNAINKALEEEYSNQIKLEKQIREVTLAKKESESSLRNIVKSQDKYDESEYKRLIDSLSKIDPKAKDAKLQIRELNAEIKSFGVTSKEVSNTTNSFSDSLKRFTAFYGLYDLFTLGKQAITSMKDSVYELNHAITELNKTADISNMDSFIDKAYQLSDTVSKTGSEVVLAASEFSKAGFGESEKELLKFAESALMLTNVGDGISDIATASKSLIAAMRGFDTTDSQGILDIVNAVSNASGSNFEDISFSLQRMSGTLGQMNVSVSESVAAFSTVNEILQSAEVSSSGLSSLFMRMRGLSEDTGESIDGLIPKLEKLYNTVGITMVDENGQLRDTLDVMKELSAIWEDLSINQKQLISQESAGIRQAKVFNTFVSNFSRYEELLAEGLSSAGSAAKENEVYLESLAGMTQSLKSQLEALSNESISQDFIKSILSLTTNMVSLVRETGGLIPLLQTISGIIITLNAQSTGKFFGDMIKSFTSIGSSAKKLIQIFGNVALGTQTLSGAFSALNISATTLATGGIGLLIAAMGVLSMHSNKMKAESEARIRETSELAQKYLASANSIQQLREEYDYILDTYKDERIAKEKLNELQDKLISSFGLEASGIDLVNGKYSEQKEILDGLSNTKMQKAIREAREDLENTLSGQALNTKGMMFFTNNVDSLSSNDKDKIRKIAEMVNSEFKDAMKVNFTDDLFGRSTISIDSRNIQAQELMVQLLRDAKLESYDVNKSFKNMYSTNAKWADDVSIKQATLNDLLAQQIVLNAKSESGIASYDSATKQQYDLFIDNAYKQIDATSDTVKAKEELKDIIDDIANKSFPQFNNSISESEKTFNNLTKSFDVFRNESDTTVSSIELLNKAINSLSSGQTLTSDSILELLEKFPSLRSEITNTNGVYSISESALLDLKNQAVDTFTTMAEDQKKFTTSAIDNAKSRITAYQKELEQLKKLASAQTLMSAFDSNKTAMGYGDLTQDARSSKAISEKEAQLKQEQADMQKYLDLINQIEIKEQDFNIASSTGNTKKGSNISNKKDKKGDNPLDGLVKDIQSARNQVDIELDKLNKQFELYELKGLDTTDTSNKIGILLSQRKQLTEEENKSYRLLQQRFTKEEDYARLQELINSNSSQWFDDRQSQLEHEINLLNSKYDLEKRAYDDRIKQLEIEQMLMHEDSSEYQSIEQQKLNMLVELQQSYQDKIRQLKEMGLSNEQEDVRKYIDLYVDAEEERLNLTKSMAEKRRQAEIKANQDLMNNLNKVDNAPKELLDMVMQMLRQETQARKEELDKQLGDKKEALEKEYDAEKKSIDDRLSLIKKEADERKKVLRKESDERNYNRGLEEKNKKIKDVEDKLLSLSNDDSIQALKKRKELEAELARYKQELEDYQYDHQIDIREEAIDEELKAQEDKINKELESLEDKHKEELDMLDKKHKQEIKKYEEMLSSQKKLRDEALKLIEKGERELYDKLIAWNDEYGSGISEDITSAWNNAYMAMNEYGNGSNNVLETIVAMRKEMERLVEESERLAETTWKDYEDNKPSNGSGGSSSKPNKDDDWYGGHDDKDDKAKFRDKQLEKMIELGDKMRESSNNDDIRKWKSEQESIAKTIGAYNQDGTWYVMINNKKYRVRDAIGVRHQGLLQGRISDGLKPNEQIMKLTKDEWVFTGNQMDNLTKNANHLLNVKATPTNSNTNLPPININMSFGSVTNDTLPDLKKLIKVEVPKILNDTLLNKGIRAR